MPDLLVWHVSDRNPSITENITVDGVAFDLSSSTVKFQMRPVGSSTLKVDAAATITNGPLGLVRYDWTASDVDTAGDYLVWWQVTTTGKIQDVGEAVIQVLAHAPLTSVYCELEEFKKTTNLDGLMEYDVDIKRALRSASEAIDFVAEQPRGMFAPSASQSRYYTPTNGWTLRVDPISTITTLKTDEAGDGTFENTWTVNVDYTREPLNAAADGHPWTTLCVHPTGSFRFPAIPRSVELTGLFGWPAVPPSIKDATIMLAHRIVKREREAPTGIVGFGLDGAVVRMMASDPDVMALVAPFSRAVLVA